MFSYEINADDALIVKKVCKEQSAVVRKNNSLKSIEELLRKNNDNHDSNVDGLLSRIQTTKDALSSISCRRKINKKNLKKEVEKINQNLKEIVDKYNELVTDKVDNKSSIVEDEAFTKSSSPVKSHAIVALDWRKKLRFNGMNNPIQELTSPLTEENIIEFVNENQSHPDNVLGAKDIPDSDIGCSSTSSSSSESPIKAIDVQKDFH